MAVSTVTLGEIERCDAVRGLVITRARHAAGLQLVAHEHERANMSIALGGSFFERIGNRVFECGVGSVLVKPSGARHSNAYVSATDSVLLETTDRCLDGLFRDSAHFYSPRFSTAARHIIVEIQRQQPGYELIVEGLAFELFGSALRTSREPSSAHRPWLRAVRDIIEAEYRSIRSLRAIAAAVGRHPSHVAREFRRAYGMTIGELARELRFRDALKQIETSETKLVDIALTCGFRDQSHLTREAKQRTGLTPGALRG